MVEAEALISSCCPKICYQSFCQHELFEVGGDIHNIFHGQKQFRSIFDIPSSSQLKEYKPKKSKSQQTEMRRREMMAHWGEVKLWKIRTAECVYRTLDTYIHRGVPRRLSGVF